MQELTMPDDAYLDVSLDSYLDSYLDSWVATRVHLDANGRDLTVERGQDVEDILARNKALRAQDQRCDWGRHIASIPCVILERWLNEEAARGNQTIRWGSREFDALVARKLRDPDWAYLRTDRPSLIMGWMGLGS